MDSKNMGMSLLLIFAALVSQTMSRSLLDTSMLDRHEQWMVQHNRVYKNDTDKYKRFNVFKDNVERIELFNQAGNAPYKLGVNQFADLTNEEFKLRNRFKSHVCSSSTDSFRYGNISAVPATIDWRKKGAVTPVKDQGQCGELAFIREKHSLINQPEGITQLTTGKLISLSEQELVDCDVNGVDEGCNGGLMDDAFKFIKSNGGLTTESNYPYAGTDEKCSKNKAANHATKITGFEDVPANSESALLKAVANHPVSVAIDAGGFGFQFYSGGVFTGACGTSLDHGVTAVGYGTADDGTKYWLVKNSWGASWGEEGYIRMERGISAKEGLLHKIVQKCHKIAMQASYPTAA